MILLKNLLLILLVTYSLGINPLTAMDEKEGSEQPKSSSTQKLTERQNEGMSLKTSAVKFYAQNYGAINFVTFAVPVAAYGIYSFINYIGYVQQQQREWYDRRIALYNQQREAFVYSCELATQQCNGTWIPIQSCPTDLLQSPCYRVLFDCVSKLCGWNLFLAPNSDSTAAQLLVNTPFNTSIDVIDG